MNLRNLWSQLRETIRNNFSFAQIKGITGEAGLPVYQINDVQQKWQGGSSKGQLMDALDGLFAKENSESQDRIVKNLLKKIGEQSPELKETIQNIVSSFGWGLTKENEPYPLRLQLRLVNLESNLVTEVINMTMKRFRDGDYSGAITSICGIIDKLTETIYSIHGLDNHKSDSFQSRVSNSIAKFENDYKNFLLKNGKIDSKEIDLIWNNYKKSISNSAYVVGAFRREFSDVHGNIRNDLDTNIVQNCLDNANHIFSALINLKEKNFA